MFILDTNVLSEAMRPIPDQNVSHWMAQQDTAALYTTAISQAEIVYGAALLTQGKKQDNLWRLIYLTFDVSMNGRILSFDSEAANIYGLISAHRKNMGRPISQADAQIAAIARAHKFKLVTRNTKDFIDCGIDLIDPWHAA